MKGAISRGLAELMDALRDLRGRPSLAWFLGSSMFYRDLELALRCLERVARVDPIHRAVRTLIDHHYAAESRGEEPWLQFTLPLEEIEDA